MIKSGGWALAIFCLLFLFVGGQGSHVAMDATSEGCMKVDSARVDSMVMVLDRQILKLDSLLAEKEKKGD